MESLPEDLQAVVEGACRVVNADMEAEFTARNPVALAQLQNEHGVEVRGYPADVVESLKRVSAEVAADVAKSDPLAGKVYEAYMAFLESARSYTRIGEYAYLKAREG
jgi:TRAP-type mannitol/chloroaromatic compound transport system substrate-binding protein